MFFDGRSRRSANGSATELRLEDLIAQKPRRGASPRERGTRGPLGERPGRGRAQSLDFDGAAPYAPGDDVRHIDWRTSARSGSTQIRKFSAHSHCSHVIIADLNPQLYFGTQTRLMAKTVALMAARLTWQCLAWDEPVGLIVPGKFRLRPRTGRRHLMQALDQLLTAYRAPVDGPSLLAEALVTGAADLQRGDEICVVSDFGADLEPILAAGRPLSEAYRLRAYVVEDALARTPPPAGSYPASLVDRGDARTFAINGRGPHTGLHNLRRSRRAALLDHDWHIVEAEDVLPLADGTPP